MFILWPKRDINITVNKHILPIRVMSIRATTNNRLKRSKWLEVIINGFRYTSSTPLSICSGHNHLLWATANPHLKQKRQTQQWTNCNNHTITTTTKTCYDCIACPYAIIFGFYYVHYVVKYLFLFFFFFFLVIKLDMGHRVKVSERITIL